MRKRKSLKKEDESDASDPGAEPEEFQDSGGEDWTPDADAVCFTFYSFLSGVILYCRIFVTVTYLSCALDCKIPLNGAWFCQSLLCLRKPRVRLAVVPTNVSCENFYNDREVGC